MFFSGFIYKFVVKRSLQGPLDPKISRLIFNNVIQLTFMCVNEARLVSPSMSDYMGLTTWAVLQIHFMQTFANIILGH